MRMHFVLICLFSLFLPILSAQTAPDGPQGRRVAPSNVIRHELAPLAPLTAKQITTMTKRPARAVLTRELTGQNDALTRLGAANQVSVGVPLNATLAAARLGKAQSFEREFYWTVPIESVDALGIRARVDLGRLDRDERVYFVTQDRNRAYGPFTVEDGAFWSPQVQGSRLYLILVSPDPNPSLLTVTDLNHTYKDDYDDPALDCHWDVSCEDLAMQELGSAVGHYFFIEDGDGYVATGALINSSDWLEIPYFLTANHAIYNQELADTIHIYWDFRSTFCDSGDIPDMDLLPQTYDRVVLEETSANLDLSLLRLPSYGTEDRTFLGYDTTVPAWNNMDLTCIHHPSGSYQRISAGHVTHTNQNSCGGEYSHQFRVFWDLGLTEGGSSGSPFFDEDGYVFGALTGCGPENCGGDNYDYVSSLYHFYDQVEYLIGAEPKPSVIGQGTQVSLQAGETYRFTRESIGGLASLGVKTSGVGNVDLYVKTSPINWPAHQGAHDEDQFKSALGNGPDKTIHMQRPITAPYHVLVHAKEDSQVSVVFYGISSPAHYPTWQFSTPHNYGHNQVYEKTYSIAKAYKMGIKFEELRVHPSDTLQIVDEHGEIVHEVNGNLVTNGNGSPFGWLDGWVYVPGNTLTLRLITDGAGNDFGIETSTGYYRKRP